MNNLKNSIRLVGNVGQDPEIVVLESGRKLAKFSLATNEYYVNALGERVEQTTWHRIVFWNKSAEIVEQYVKQGSRLLVEGSLSNRSWEDAQGEKHYRTEIVGREMMLL